MAGGILRDCTGVIYLKVSANAYRKAGKNERESEQVQRKEREREKKRGGG